MSFNSPPSFPSRPPSSTSSLTMAKANTTNGGQPPLPSASSIQNRDLLLRLSFMHQAATFLHVAQQQHTSFSSSQPVASSSTSTSPRSRKGKERAHPETAAEVADEKQGEKKTSKRKRRQKEDGREGSLARLGRRMGEGIGGIAVHNKAKL